MIDITAEKVRAVHHGSRFPFFTPHVQSLDSGRDDIWIMSLLIVRELSNGSRPMTGLGELKR